MTLSSDINLLIVESDVKSFNKKLEFYRLLYFYFLLRGLIIIF